MDYQRQGGQAYGARTADPQAQARGQRPAQAPAHAADLTPRQSRQPVTAPTGFQMKRRNPLGAGLGLPIITLGIYGMVWFVKVNVELVRFNPHRRFNTVSAIMSMFFGVVTLGIWNWVVWVKLAGHIGDAQQSAGLRPTCTAGMAFIMALIGFGPFYYQTELNKIIDRYGVPADTAVPVAA